MKLPLLACLLLLPADDLEPGLIAEYFELKGGAAGFPRLAPGQKPVLVRVEKNVRYEDASGEFYGTKLESNFYARWTGVLRVEKAGTYGIHIESDDGSRVSIGGKGAVDNGGVHPMTEKSGQAELAAGDHALLVEFFQGGGEAGCKLSWTPPGGGKRAIPDAALLHRKGAEKIDWDEAAWKKRKGGAATVKKGSGRFAEMDHGPFFSGTVDSLFAGKGSFANKGMAIRLSEEPASAVLFDSELLKLSAGWTGGYIGYPSGRDGIEGQQFADGTHRFGTKKGSLGWAKDGSFADPRKPAYGPLPRDWARYRGLYLHGAKTVLAYTVGGAEILELPAWQDGLFTRSFQVTKSPGPLRMLVCEKDGATGAVADGVATLAEGDTLTAVGLSGPGTLEIANGTRIELKIPGDGRFQLLLWRGPQAELPKFAAAAPPDLAPLLKGGPGRNPEIVTQGRLGPDAEAYSVDTLTVPYDNPSKSYMRLTGIDFFSDGKRAAVCTMDGDVWVVSGIDAALEKLTWKRFASGLFQSLGLRIVDDVVYTLGRDQITRLHDLNADGEADFYECFNNDCGVSPGYHEFTHDLQTDSQGNFYYAKGSDLGGPKFPYHGCVVRVSKDGKTSEVFARGFRAPNGMSVGPDGTVTTSDNQGNWVPTTPINYFTKPGDFGGFLPCAHQSPAPAERPAPLCWIPYSMDNSGGGQVWVTSDKWGPFKGGLLHLSYGKCLLFHVLREKTADGVQGGVVKFPFKFASGVMRGRFNPVDGQLYLVGMRGWQTDGQLAGCFQRVRYTGKPANLPLSAKVTPKGIEFTFTDPLDRASAENLQNISAAWANLKWTGAYGSDEFWVSDPKKKGREPLEIRAARLLPDGKTLALDIPGLKPVYYAVFRWNLRGADGAEFRQEVAYTINRLP
jgi:hypothetical protein